MFDWASYKKEMLHLIGVTYQTVNVRNIINPLIQAGCLAPIEDDKSKLRNVQNSEHHHPVSRLKIQ